jgi:hypothetical protein
MAAPYVAGAAALYKSQFPNASPAQTMAGLEALRLTEPEKTFNKRSSSL